MATEPTTPFSVVKTSAAQATTFLQQGYKMVYKKPCITTGSQIKATQNALTQAGYQQVPDRNLYVKIGNGSDGKMKPPPGSVPTGDLRYSMYVVTSASDSGNSNAIDLSVTAFTAVQGFLPIPITNVSFQRSSIVFCNTFFEGQEYIDIPVSEFKKVYGQAFQNGQGSKKQYTKPLQFLEAPNPVFKVIYIGNDKLVPENSTSDLSYWMSMAPYLGSNQANGTDITEYATYDIKKGFQQRTINTDTASNRIKCNGGIDFNLDSKMVNGSLTTVETDVEETLPGYISYIGMTKPMFRDVIMTSSSTAEVGTALMGTYVPSSLNTGGGPTPISSPQARVLRFAWVNMGDSESPQYQWRLSESFGVQKALANIQPTPQGVGRIVSAEAIEHYVYDLNDKTNPEWTGFYPSIRIMKPGYEVNYALAKMDSKSVFYDAEFSAKIVPQNSTAEVVYGPGTQGVLVSNSVNFYAEEATTLLTGYNAVCGVTSTVGAIGSLGATSLIKKHTYVYTSPRLEAAFGSNARTGMEYSFTFNGSTLLESSDAALLIRSSKSPTICSTYDPCLAAASVFDIIEAGSSTSIVERSVDDTRWAQSLSVASPTSEYSHFMLGEYPYRSDGTLVFIPKTEDLKMDVSDGNFSIPSGKLPILIEFSVVEYSDTKGTFKLYPTTAKQGTPSYEISLGELPANASGTMSIIVPPKNFASYSPGGGIKSIASVYGCDNGAVISDALKPYANDDLDWRVTEKSVTRTVLSTYSDAQVANIPQLKFPVKATSVSATSDCISGYTILAYEITGRIDLGFRSAHFGSFIPLRDIVLRIPNDENLSGKSLPEATNPILMSDYNTKNLYLFYLYKNSLVVKEIPEELMSNLIGESKTFSAQPEKESEAIKRIHMLNSNMIYQTDVSDQSILTDMKFGALKFYTDLSVPTGMSESINEYCVFYDQIGYLYAAIQTTRQIYIFRSYNGGEVWENLIPKGFSFYPPKRVTKGNTITTERQKPSEGDAAIPQYPFVMVDWQTQTGCFFYFVDDNLLVFDLPMELLRQNKTDLPDILSAAISPRLVVGSMTFDMIQRGITYGTEELANKSPPIKAIPQKVTGVITQNGAYRVFFRDSNGFLKSIISTSLNGSWVLEEDFQKEAEA